MRETLTRLPLQPKEKHDAAAQVSTARGTTPAFIISIPFMGDLELSLSEVATSWVEDLYLMNSFESPYR